jgi:hypothetical protein
MLAATSDQSKRLQRWSAASGGAVVVALASGVVAPSFAHQLLDLAAAPAAALEILKRENLKRDRHLKAAQPAGTQIKLRTPNNQLRGASGRNYQILRGWPERRDRGDD